MTRKECLEQAMGCVLRDRNNEYGEPENSFDLIADLWTAYTGHVFIGSDVAAMMALLKLARLKRNARHLDSAVDLAGYAACFAECASAETARPVPFASKAEDQPEFKPGDKVQVYYPSIEEWRDATYVSFCQMSRDCWRHEVEFASGGRRYVPREQIRPMPKAEGCESLVEHDAPQTPEEVCRHIVESNPATYGQPRTPTGEELAEMAEEEKHG